MTPERIIIESAYALACSLPSSTVEAVAAAILTISEGSLRAEISKRVAHHQHRDMALAFVDVWRNKAKELDSRTVAVALQTAALSELTHRDAHSTELVWTGPDVDGVPFRRTEQAILQVLDSATKRITLVSYAVYRIPRICDALVRAAHRGVRINVVVETPNKIEGQTEYNTIQALGDSVASVSAVYYWPEEKRSQAVGGKHGILHVKCAVADGRWLFLSSANLTDYAFTINMELGLLVTGGPLPGQVEEQFDRLIGMGVLERV